MLKYLWVMEMKGQQRSIQLQMDTVLRFLATGSGRLVVDGSIIGDWGCNPFRMIPKGSYEFQIDGKKAFVRSRFGIVKPFFLFLDEQEISPSLTHIAAARLGVTGSPTRLRKTMGLLSLMLGIAGITLLVINYTVDNILDGFVFLPAVLAVVLFAVGWGLLRRD